MKNILVMAVAGIGLFAGTSVGLLAAQGRLNYEGTRGIPLLSMLFSEPPKKEGKDGKDGKEAKDASGEKGAAEHGTDPHAKPEDQGHGEPKSKDERSKLVKTDEPLPFRKAKSILNPPKEDGGGGHGGGGGGGGEHGAPADHGKAESGSAEHGKAEEHAADHAKEGDQGHGDAKKPTEWQQKVDDLMGEGQYRRGRLFQFQRLEGGMSSDELNEILKRAQKMQQDLENREKAIEKRKQELDARENDIRDRQKAVADKLVEIQAERAKLEREVEEFHKTVLLIRHDEEKGFQDLARTLSSFEPKKSADILLEMWQTEEGQVKALKILTVMDAEASDAIVGEFQTKQIRDFLEKRLKVIREENKATKK